MTTKLTIGFVRRGYSPTGGAEAYLERLAQGVVEAGHDVHLITTKEWRQENWPVGTITRLGAKASIGFADELEQIRSQICCDALLSLERVWSCDANRAAVCRLWLAP